MSPLKNSLIASILLALSASAAPLTGTTSEHSPANEFLKRDSINDCGDSSFINQSSDGSPLISDCQQIITNISGGGTWDTYEGAIVPPRQIVSYGTCVMDVLGHTPYDGTFKVGNQDVIDLINSSIQMFGWEGKVGAMGTMNCQHILGGEDYTSTVDWRLYHT